MGRRGLVSCALVWAGLLVSPATARAEFQVKPFLGFTFGASTTFVDPAGGQETKHLALGVSAVFLGNIFGIEAEVSQVPKFFQRGEADLSLNSVVNTVTGSLIVALPRKWSGYSLRPYAVVGYGLLHARKSSAGAAAFDVTSNMGALDIGGGATGFFSDRFGVSWDVRYIRRVSGGPDKSTGLVFGDPELSFWRASMAFVVR